MNNSDILNVWYEHSLVGQIWRDVTGKMGFHYNEDWMTKGFPISQQLPLNRREYSPTEGQAHKFFANLLPEAGARHHIIKDRKIVDDDFELLKEIGGECAGAFSILLPNSSVEEVSDYQHLNNETLKKVLLRKGNITNFDLKEKKPRLSLAGAQDKLPILFQNNNYFLPLGSAPSTHLLKFETADYSHVPAYEYILSKLASVIGLPVVECKFQKYNKNNFLLIKRYDRVLEKDGSIRRIHQEDFCQALGYAYTRKYQAEGGPTFKQCYEMVLNVSATPIVDTENLLKWQMFNFLAGNSDGHAKNLAIVYNQQTGVMAPFYDLVCTRAIAQIDSKLAMAIGGEFDPGKVSLAHWQNLAKECKVREEYLLKLLEETAHSLIQNASAVIKNFEDEHGSYPASQRVLKVIQKQCKKIIK